jgi:hypothetical protein
MDELLQMLRLLPALRKALTPRGICMLRCTCSELRDMRVSWSDHSIDFHLKTSVSALSWLHKNIASMRQIRLTIGINLPRGMLQDVMKGSR